jgi:hypothetical protein
VVITPADLSQYMAAIGRKGGQIGGKRRMKTMTKEQAMLLYRRIASEKSPFHK